MTNIQTPLTTLAAQYAAFGISENVLNFAKPVMDQLRPRFDRIDETAEYNQLRVIHAMQENHIGEAHLKGTTGYGYDDIGRDGLERVYASYFGTEDALVRPQISCGTHALALALMGTYCFDRKDYAGAVRHWSKMREGTEPGSEEWNSITDNIEQARNLGGIKAPAEEAALKQAAKRAAAAVREAVVEGEVSRDDREISAEAFGLLRRDSVPQRHVGIVDALLAVLAAGQDIIGDIHTVSSVFFSSFGYSLFFSFCKQLNQFVVFHFGTSVCFKSAFTIIHAN